MIRPRLCVLALAVCLLAPPVWAQGPFKRADLERDLELTLRLSTEGPVEAGAPLRVELRIANRAKDRSYPVVVPGDGAQYGVTEPYVWFTARVREAGATAWRPVDPWGPAGMCGMGDWSWHRLVETLAPGASLEVKDHLQAVNLDLAVAGTLEIIAHYAFLADREQPRLPGAEGKGDLGPMKGVPAFEITSKPVTVEVIRPLDLRVTRGKKRLALGKQVQLSQVMSATLTNASGAAVTFSKNQVSVGLELRADDRPPVGIERKLVEGSEPKDRTVADGATVSLLGAEGWYDETLKPTKPLKGKVEGRLVLRIAGAQPRTIRSSWLRLD